MQDDKAGSRTTNEEEDRLIAEYIGDGCCGGGIGPVPYPGCVDCPRRGEGRAESACGMACMPDERNETTDNRVVAELQRLARGSAGYEFRSQLRDRYLNAFRAAYKTDNLPRVIYLNGWWELPHGRRRRTADFIRMILRLEERGKCLTTATKRPSSVDFGGSG